MAYNITLEGKNKIIAERMLEKVAIILDELSITYWLEGGTLLGIRRENRLLPWDNDIDISMMFDQKEKLPQLYKTLKEHNFRVRKRFFESDTDVFKKGMLRMIKIREQKFFGLVKGPVCLDIFIKYPIEDNAFWQIDGKTKSVPYKFYQNFKNISFKEKKYSIPQLTDEYLSYRYGNWETPVKDWNTSKDDKALH